MITTIRSRLACLLVIAISIGCDYVLPEEEGVDPSSNVTNYAPNHSVLCGPNLCGPTQICCLDPIMPDKMKCTVESDCANIPIACDGAEDCIADAVCCGERAAEIGSPSAMACTRACDNPDVRMCRMENGASTCLSGTTCAPIIGFPPGFGFCKPLPP